MSLVYYEACLSQDDAFRRERYLKTGKRKRYVRLPAAEARPVDSHVSRDKLERHAISKDQAKGLAEFFRVPVELFL
jgi:hypothetical protein